MELQEYIGEAVDLDEDDKRLIIEQCLRQNATSPEQIKGFAEAYRYVKDLAKNQEALGELNQRTFMELILRLGSLVESRNEKGFRRIPVTFSSGGTALAASEIPHAIKNFISAYLEDRFKPDEAFEEFERIHPFEDGNGRVGDLLWKLAISQKRGIWPKRLPPDVFGDPERKQKDKSAFGEIDK